MTCFPRQILCCMLMRYIDQAQLWKTAGGLLMEQCGQCVGQGKTREPFIPNGLVGHLYGLVEGQRHDSGMLASSRLLQDLQRFSNSPVTGLPMYVYGDPAYPLRAHLQGPYKGSVLTLHQHEFNKSISSARVSVELVFNDIINCFKFLDFKKNLKVGLSAVGKMYIVCALMQNAYTILYGSV